MGETLTPRQLCNNSYHLAIRSSLLAIQSTLFLQETMLQSQHATFTDIKATIASQNLTLQKTTKTLVDLFSKISSYQSPALPQPRSVTPPQIHAATVSVAASPVRQRIPTITSEFVVHKTVIPTSDSASITITDSATMTAPDSSTVTIESASDPCVNQMDICSDELEIPHMMDQTENITAAHVTSGNQNLDFFFQVVLGTPSSRGTDLLSKSWDHDPLIALKLVCDLHGVRRTASFAEFGYMKYSIVVCDGSDSMMRTPMKVGIDLGKLLSEPSEETWKGRVITLSSDPKKRADAYNMLVLLLEKNETTIFEQALFVFDPGGTFNFESIFDLEDKVVFEGVAMIRISQECSTKIHYGYINLQHESDSTFCITNYFFYQLLVIICVVENMLQIGNSQLSKVCYASCTRILYKLSM